MLNVLKYIVFIKLYTLNIQNCVPYFLKMCTLNIKNCVNYLKILYVEYTKLCTFKKKLCILNVRFFK